MPQYIIYSNSLMYLLVSLIFTKGAFAVYISDVWNTMNAQSFMISLLILSALYSATLSVGLLLRKVRTFDKIIYWNILMGVLFGIIPSVLVLYTLGIKMFLVATNSATLISLATGMTFFLLAYLVHVNSKKGNVK